MVATRLLGGWLGLLSYGDNSFGCERPGPAHDFYAVILLFILARHRSGRKMLRADLVDQ